MLTATAGCKARGEFIHGPQIAEFEAVFARRNGMESRVEPAGAPGADRAAGAMQIPVYSTLSDSQIQRVAKVVRDVLTHA